MSKSDNSKNAEQEYRLLSKYYDMQIAWLRSPGGDTLAEYRKVSEEYRRQYDRG